MKRKFAPVQKAYMLAKANLETLEAHEKKIDRQYIVDNGIKNPDGSIPELIYCIEDESVFEKANAECSAIVETSGLWSEILEARELLKSEEKLIEYGLSIAPAYEREILTKAVKTNYSVRLKIIDLVFRLDTSTVTA